MRTAELEVVRYDTEAIKCASNDLLLGYANYSGHLGTPTLPDIEPQMRRVIAGQLPQSVSWTTPNLNIDFSGFTMRTHEMQNGRVEVVALDPFFTLEQEYGSELSVGLKAYLQTLPGALLDFLGRKHPVEIEETDIYSVVKFPRETFAKSVDRIEVPLLGNEELRI